jgi:thiamine biosynthesis lipoprotein
MSSLAVHTHAFDAMGSTVELVLIGGTRRSATDAFAKAEALAETWERTFSRFRPESELSRLNRTRGPFRPSRLLFDGVEAAVSAARATDGLFDPTILPAILSIGYDRSYARILAAGSEVAGTVGAMDTPPCGRWRDIVLDRSQKVIEMPDSVRIDLGGIAKGMYADRLAAALSRWQGGMVSAGGDMRLWGRSPDGESWIVGIEDPDRPGEDIAWVEVAGGGVATSGTNRRHWRLAGEDVHHLIDPRTARPVEGDLRVVTVVAATATDAEAAATALFVAGSMPEASSWLASTTTLAAGVDRAGQVRMLYQRGGGLHDATNQPAA